MRPTSETRLLSRAIGETCSKAGSRDGGLPWGDRASAHAGSNLLRLPEIENLVHEHTMVSKFPEAMCLPNANDETTHVRRPCRPGARSGLGHGVTVKGTYATTINYPSVELALATPQRENK